MFSNKGTLSKISEIHLRQPGPVYSACGKFTKTKKNTNIEETEDLRSIDQKELGKVWFQNDMACGDFEDLTKRIASDKILCDKALLLLKIQNMMDIKGVLLQ